MQEQPSGPTVAACAVPGGRSSRSPAVQLDVAVVGVEHDRALRGRTAPCGRRASCRPYRSPGALPHERGASHPSASNAADAAAGRRSRGSSSRPGRPPIGELVSLRLADVAAAVDRRHAPARERPLLTVPGLPGIAARLQGAERRSRRSDPAAPTAPARGLSATKYRSSAMRIARSSSGVRASGSSKRRSPSSRIGVIGAASSTGGCCRACGRARSRAWSRACAAP